MSDILFHALLCSPLLTVTKLGAYEHKHLVQIWTTDIDGNMNTVDIGNVDFNKLTVELPPTITDLYVQGANPWIKLDNLPPGLKKLTVGGINVKLDNLPLGLEVLKLCDTIYTHTLSNLPSSLRTLTINCEYTGTLDELPSTLKRLKLTVCWLGFKMHNMPHGLELLSLYFRADPDGIQITLGPNVQCVEYGGLCGMYDRTIERLMEEHPNVEFRKAGERRSCGGSGKKTCGKRRI